MASVASFNVTKSGKAFIVGVDNLRPNKSVWFQFDTGACLSLIGLNTICDDDNSKKVLKDILEQEICAHRILPSPEMPKTVTQEPLQVYPCKYEGVSIEGTQPITLYFHVYLGDIGLPLLGFDYIDDCSCHHSIGGDFMITAVAKDIGKRFYPANVIDFNEVMEQYHGSIA